MSGTPNAEATAEQASSRGRLVRNTLYLTLSQAVTIPLAVLVNALTARYLGAEEFGYIYLAGTFASFGVLAVAWGHEGVLPAMVARDHGLAGTLLGTSFVWRGTLAVVVYAFMAGLCQVLGYGGEVQWALALSFLGAVLSSCVQACKDTIRGFERTDIPAYMHIGQQVLWACLVVPVVLLGGRMRAVLVVADVTFVIVLLAILGTLRSVGVGRLSIDRGALKSLFMGGTPFVLFSLATTLQPLIDAAYLSKLGSAESVGWYAVARRLIGLLLFPANALIGALYPTLCRLWREDQGEFVRVTRGAIHSVALLVMPIALACGLYPDVGVAIFSKKAFGPAADDLRVSAFFLFLVYFTMPIGTCVLACGRQRAWSVVQSLCVGVSLLLDPVLTPWFQRRMNNGGLGPCVAAVVSETIVVVCGLWLIPGGVFDAKLRRTLLIALLSGAAMALTARLLRSVTPFVAAPLASLAYAGGLWAAGEIDRSHVARVTDVVRRKLSRAR